MVSGAEDRVRNVKLTGSLKNPSIQKEKRSLQTRQRRGHRGTEPNAMGRGHGRGFHQKATGDIVKCH